LVLTATSETDLQQIYDTVEAALRENNMIVSLDKTEVMKFQRTPGIGPQVLLGPQIRSSDMGEHLFIEAHTFKYLGQRKQRGNCISAEITARIQSATAVYLALRRRIFCHRGIPRHTRISLFRSLCMSRLTYALHTLPLTQNDLRRVERFQNRKLRRICKIPIWKGINYPNAVVRAVTKMPSVEHHVQRRRVTMWRDTVLGPPHSLMRITLGGEAANQQPTRLGGQRVTLKKGIKAAVETFGHKQPPPEHSWVRETRAHLEGLQDMDRGDRTYFGLWLIPFYTQLLAEYQLEYPPPAYNTQIPLEDHIQAILPAIRSKNNFQKALKRLPAYTTSVDPIKRTGIPAFPCPVCLAPFYTEGDMKNHHNQAHKEAPKLPRARWIPCKSQHGKTIKTINGTTCPLCQMTFQNQARCRWHWSFYCGRGWTPNLDCKACETYFHQIPNRDQLPYRARKHTCGWKCARARIQAALPGAVLRKKTHRGVPLSASQAKTPPKLGLSALPLSLHTVHDIRRPSVTWFAKLPLYPSNRSKLTGAPPPDRSLSLYWASCPYEEIVKPAAHPEQEEELPPANPISDEEQLSELSDQAGWGNLSEPDEPAPTPPSEPEDTEQGEDHHPWWWSVPGAACSSTDPWTRDPSYRAPDYEERRKHAIIFMANEELKERAAPPPYPPYASPSGLCTLHKNTCVGCPHIACLCPHSPHPIQYTSAAERAEALTVGPTERRLVARHMSTIPTNPSASFLNQEQLNGFFAPRPPQQAPAVEKAQPFNSASLAQRQRIAQAELFSTPAPHSSPADN
jgi:hypothetical protein